MKITTVARPRPVFRAVSEGMANPPLLPARARISATSSTGFPGRMTGRSLTPFRRCHSSGVIRPRVMPLPASSVGNASQNPSRARIVTPLLNALMMCGALVQMFAAASRDAAPPRGKDCDLIVRAKRLPSPALMTCCRIAACTSFAVTATADVAARFSRSSRLFMTSGRSFSIETVNLMLAKPPDDSRFCCSSY